MVVVLIVDCTYPADGQWKAPPRCFVIITVMEQATGTHTIKAPFTVSFLVPDDRLFQIFLRELNEGDSKNISLS